MSGRKPAFLECSRCRACQQRQKQGFPPAPTYGRFIVCPVVLVLAWPVAALAAPVFLALGDFKLKAWRKWTKEHIADEYAPIFRTWVFGNSDHRYDERYAKRKAKIEITDPLTPCPACGADRKRNYSLEQQCTGPHCFRNPHSDWWD